MVLAGWLPRFKNGGVSLEPMGKAMLQGKVGNKRRDEMVNVQRTCREHGGCSGSSRVEDHEEHKRYASEKTVGFLTPSRVRPGVLAKSVEGQVTS